MIPPADQPPPDRAWATRHFALLLVSFALALVLRLRGIQGESPWCDEVLTLQCLPSDSLAGYLQCVFGADPRLALSPLYYLLQFAWGIAVGGGTLELRLLSVLLGLLGLVGIAAAAGRLGGPSAAGRAALLGACSLSLVYYSQEVRFYALLLVWGALSWWGLIVWLQDRRCRWAEPVHLAANFGLLFTHAFSPVLFLGQGVGLAILWGPGDRRLWRWALVHVLMLGLLAGYAAWLRYDFGSHSEAFADARPGVRELIVAVLVLAGARFGGESTRDYLAAGGVVEFLVVGLVLGLALWGLIAARPWLPGGGRRPVLLLVCGAALPVLALLALSWGWRPVFFTRYILPAAIPLLLLGALGLGAVPGRLPRRLVLAATALLLLYPPLMLERPWRPDYDALAREITTGPSCHKRVLALKTFNGIAVQHAVGAYAAVRIEEGYGDLIDRCRGALDDGNEVWVVLHHWDRVSEFPADLDRPGARIRPLQYAGMPPLHAVHVAPPGAD
jgi:hypothetical protein